MSSRKATSKKRKTIKPARQYSVLLTRKTSLVFSFSTQSVPKRQQLPILRLLLVQRISKFIKSKFRKTTKSKKTKKQNRINVREFLRTSAVFPLLMVTVGVGGTLYFGLQAGSVKKLEPVKAFALPTPKPKSIVAAAPKGMPRSEPTHIKIASVGIDYPVITVGRDPDGSMQTPPLFDKVTGWYKYSPTPGEIGPSVIVGHVDSYKGPNVFWRLKDIKAGDEIEVTRADGKAVKFKVEALKQFDQNNFPSSEVYGNIDHAGLRLITCGGTYDRQAGRYTANTVVYASLIL